MILVKKFKNLPRMNGIKSKWTLAPNCQDIKMASAQTIICLDKLLNLYNSCFLICRLGISVSGKTFWEGFWEFKKLLNEEQLV